MSPSPLPTAADLLIEELQARDVPFIATLNGHGLDPLLLACQRARMRVIDVRNEQAASYMAEVAGRLGRQVGVCAVSGAVAHANALTGVLNAWFDGAPMLLITGITPLADLGWGQFQDFNPVPMAAPICKYARLIDLPQRVAQITHEAFAAATSGRPGPVHLALPLDVAATHVEAAVRSPRRTGSVRIEGAAPDDLVEEAARQLAAAQRPVVVAGSGLYYARGEMALARFLDRWRIPTVVPIWDRGTIPQPRPEFMGVCGAATGGPRLLPEADLLLLAGTEWDYRIGHGAPPGVAAGARIIRIHADPGRLRQGLEPPLCLAGSPATVLAQIDTMCERIGVSPADTWLQEAARRRDEHRARCRQHADQLPAGINGRDVVDAVRKVVDDQTILLVDGGNIGQWFHQLATDRYPGHWLTCGASGVVGWGLPGAMAARALHADRPVLLLSGDGSFTFTLGELECAARQSLPFVALVADDEQWGISVSAHRQHHGRPLYSELGPTRLDRVAEGLGCRGIRIEALAALIPALEEALRLPVPTVIHVPIVPASPAL